MSKKAVLVTLGLANGNSYKTWLEEFSPYRLRLICQTDPQAKRRQIETKHIAFVGFYKDDEGAGGQPDLPQTTELRVHVAGGKVFQIRAVSSTLQKTVGFFGYPTEARSPYTRIFFYPHGINLIEDTKRLGDLLLTDGHVNKDEIAQGVETQHTQRGTLLGQILVQQNKISPQAAEQAQILRQQRKRVRIGEVLVEEGLITQGDLDLALAEQKKRRGKRIGEILVEKGILDEGRLFQTLAKKFHLPFVDLQTTKINLEALKEIDAQLLRKYVIFPLDTNDRMVVVALSDPLATEVYDALRFHVSKNVVEVLAMPSQVRAFLARYVDAESDSDGLARQLTDDPLELEWEEAPEELEQDELVTQPDNVVVKLANKIILDACERGASDIHIEPRGRKENTCIRIRIDGECEIYQEIPAKYWRPLVARLKVMAQLDISERRKPQDGKIRLQRQDRHIELRVATIPTVSGNEDVVLRILASSRPMALDEMGMSARHQQAFLEIIHKPYGLFLCVGPTGSGKTTTLHSALHIINRLKTKIWTAEDPVEITQPRLRQVQVNPKIGFTFAAALRAFLRADPDVIMIGEMRDQETAAIALQAALTGHLVLSTLHTNSAPETLTRLLNMGTDPFMFADALLGVLAQRLTRGLCQSCRASYIASTEEYEELARLYGKEQLQERYGVGGPTDVTLWRAVGCADCHSTGYRGRLAIHELLVVHDDLRQAIERRLPASEIRALAVRHGMRTLLQDGIEKVMAGTTDLKQVLAVCLR